MKKAGIVILNEPVATGKLALAHLKEIPVSSQRENMSGSSVAGGIP